MSSFVHEASTEPSESPILNPFVKNLSAMLASNGDLRGVFANYMASSVWMKGVMQKDEYMPDEAQSGRGTMDGLHRIDHLRYELPTGELFPSASHSITAKVVDAVTAAEEIDARQHHRELRRRHKTMVDTHTSLGSESVQLLLCAALMSSFVQSQAFCQWNEKSQSDDQATAGIADHNQTALDLTSLLRSAASTADVTPSATQGLSLAKALLCDDDGDDDHSDVVVIDDPLSALKTAPSLLTQSALVDDDGDTGAQTAPSYYETFLVQTVAKMDVLALSDALSTDLWLREVLRFLDTLPVAITISDAHRRPTGDTFPLIYVNRAFEKLTGYHRQDVLGRNCRFLQTEERTEMRQVELLQAALRDGRPTKLALTNVRKDGTSFLNFLALRPVVNRERQYAFVVGILYDISQAKCVAQSEAPAEQEGAQLLGAGHWWHSHQDEHDRLVEDLEGIDALLRLLPMLLV